MSGMRVRIPADVERPDRILAGLTARQLAILAATALVTWTLYVTLRGVVPMAVVVGLAAPLGGVGVMVAIGQIGGQPADRLALAALAQLISPRRLVPAPEGVPAAPAWAPKAESGPGVAPLRLPAVGIDQAGVIDLGGDGAALVCRASSLNFSLKSPQEQQALVAAFGRWLNSLAGLVQILIRAEPAQLSPVVAALREAAGGLPHGSLEAAAQAHAAFLAGLSSQRDVLRREILIILREPGPDAGEVLARRAQDAIAGLAAAGITLSILGTAEAAQVISGAADPDRPPGPACDWAGPGEVVTARRRS
jgi:hypothetical protein